ncbi:Conserved_hypothetical protein [Hexamita inflata]|uniref:Uncharacterized protein n=1 Tax=Hexamita inflata TaxID=28002 RepID=A0AA86QX56_9EUKA|nr:Conserved hypothetical protein [Hexamita inflata]
MENVHTLLCKKIAQLTKVVYTLNCKAEDRDLDLGLLTKTYEVELDQVAQQFDQKYKTFSDSVLKKQQTQAQELQKALSQMKALEAEKLQFVTQFTVYKKDTELKVQKQKDQTKARFDSLLQEVDSLRKECKSQKMNFDNQLKESTAKLTNENTKLQAQLQKLQSENEQLIKDVSKAKSEAKEAQNQVDKLRSEIQFNQSDFLSQKKKLDMQIKEITQQKVDLEIDLSKVKPELVQKQKEADNLRNELEILKKNLLKSSMDQGDEINFLKQQLSKTTAELTLTKDQLKQITDKHNDLQAENVNLVNNNQTLKAKTLELGAELAQLKKQLEDYTNSLNSTNQNERKLQLALQNATDEMKHFRELYQKELEKTDKMNIQLSDLMKQIEKGEQKYNKLKTSFEQSEEKNNTYKQMIKDNQTKMEEIAKQVQILIQQLETERTNSATLSTNLNAMKAEYERRIKELTEQINRIGAGAEQNNSQMLQSIQNLQKENAEKDIQIKTLQQNIFELEKQYREANQIKDEEIQKTKHKTKLLIESINLIRKAFSEQMIELVGQINNLKQILNKELSLVDLTAIQTDLLNKVNFYIMNGDSQTKKIQEQMQNVINKHLFTIEDQAAQIKQLQMMDATKTDKIKELGEMLSQLKNTALDKEYLLQQQVKSLESQIAQMQVDLVGKNSSSQQLMDQINKLRQENASQQNTIQQLNDQIKGLNDKIKVLEEDIKSKIERATIQLNQQIEYERQQHILQLQQFDEQRKQYEQSIFKQQEQIEKLLNELKQLQTNLKDQTDLTRGGQKTIEDLNLRIVQMIQEINDKEKQMEEQKLNFAVQLQEKNQEIKNLNKNIEDLKTQLQQFDFSLQDSKQTEQDLLNKIQNLRLEHQRAIAELNAKNSQQIKQLEADFELKSQIAKDEQKQREELIHSNYQLQLQQKDENAQLLQDRIDELTQLIEAREARPEDLEKIAKLQQLIIQLKQEIKDAGKQMEWYKRELLAREESYNHRFHKEQTRVGTMQIPGVPASAMQPTLGSGKQATSVPRSAAKSTKLPSLEK